MYYICKPRCSEFACKYPVHFCYLRLGPRFCCHLMRTVFTLEMAAASAFLFDKVSELPCFYDHIV